MNIVVRKEEAKDYRRTEEVAREAFWNLYFPGAAEHYVVHKMRSHPDFIQELAFVIEVDGTVEGAIFYTHSKVVTPNGEFPTISFGPVFISPKYHRQGLGRKLITHSIEIAKEMKYDTFRLYTSKILCPEAIFFYDKLMDFGEDYTLEEIELQRRVYTKSLTDKPATKWKNKKLNLDYEKKREEKGMKKYLSSLKK